MFASLHVADVGVGRSFTFRPPSPDTTPGLLDARSGLTARFADSLKPDPAWGRAMWLAFWEDEDSLDRFLDSGGPPVADFEDGLTVRMLPVQGHGSWPGFPDDGDGIGLTPENDDGPVVVLTLGLLRLRRSVAWTRASARVQKQFLDTDGVIWAMGASRPPLFAATMSIWESGHAAKAFAHQPDEAHIDAMRANEEKPFMRQEIFARFKPVSSQGSLSASPALAADWLTDRNA